MVSRDVMEISFKLCQDFFCLMDVSPREISKHIDSIFRLYHSIKPLDEGFIHGIHRGKRPIGIGFQKSFMKEMLVRSKVCFWHGLILFM